jgi:hypothetical protein
MAAPHVTGAAALYKAMFPDATPAEVKAKIQHYVPTLIHHVMEAVEDTLLEIQTVLKEPLLFQDLLPP